MSANQTDITNSPTRVAYILKMFPRLSETFILNELLELENQGVDASVYSLMHPGDGRFHGRLAQLKLEVQYLPREKAESYWSQFKKLSNAKDFPINSWQDAADFLERWDIPKDLDLLLRAVNIAADMKSKGVQHIHAHFATIATRMAALVHLLTGIPFSFTSHAKDIFRNGVNRGLYKELVDLSAFNITVSDYNRAYILEATPGVDAEKIIRLYNGIDLEFFSKSEKPVIQNDEDIHIVSIGRLVPKKGFALLLRSLAELRQSGQKMKMTIVGGGEQAGELPELGKHLGLSSCVNFAGALPQEEVLRLTKEADIIALACVPDSGGNRDALPTTLLEALGCDRPIVSSQLTGVPEIVTHEQGAVVRLREVDSDDPNAMQIEGSDFDPCKDSANISTFAKALATTAERYRAGEFNNGNARNRALELFDLKRNVATLRSHFENSIKGSS